MAMDGFLALMILATRATSSSGCNLAPVHIEEHIMAQQSTIEATVDNADMLLTLKFSNGKEIVLEVGALSRDMQRAAMLHGVKQKLVDAAAISRNTETGQSATVEDKYQAVAEVAERLRAGEWNKTREGGGATGGLLKRALMKMYDKDGEAIDAFLAKKTKEEQAALRANPKVAAIIATLRTEPKASKSIDTDALLADLE